MGARPTKLITMKDNYLYIAALCFAGYDLKRKDAKKLLRLLS